MMEFNSISQPLGIKYSKKQCEQNALKNCSDLNDLRFSTKLSWSGWFLHLFHWEFLHCRVKNERQSQMKKTNACMVDFTLPLWVVKGGKKDMACLNSLSLSLSYYFRLLGYH